MKRRPATVATTMRLPVDMVRAADEKAARLGSSRTKVIIDLLHKAQKRDRAGARADAQPAGESPTVFD